MKKVLFLMALAIPVAFLVAAELPVDHLYTTTTTANSTLAMPDEWDLVLDEAVPTGFGFKMSAGDRMGVKFTPPNYPFTINEAAYAPTGWGDDPDNWNASCKLVFFAGGDTPGSTLGSKDAAATEQGNWNWFSVTSLNMVINSGSFFFAVENKVDDNPGLLLDGGAPLHHASWMYTIFQGETQRKWAAYDSIDAGLTKALGDTVDLMLRIRGEAAGIGEVELKPDVVRIAPSATILASNGTVNYYLPSAGMADISLWDASGRLVRTLYSGNAAAGEHSISWNAQGLAGGAYFIRLKTATDVKVTKIVLAD